ncbi:hypothetical protein [Myroides sp. DF42-4-2]|uniref:hypothetical protein n=1 Tax=Myroides sp. DF42-4-2 TaxID=2746726 RepID=UPI0025763E0A|nr:hypothetical protein [Myroides sp. DF42-4-2]MDM1409035.1 hypothetical protein [Myroides sp. DF42-4-2]
MRKLRYIYQNWSREYYKLKSEEDTCWYYSNFYKSDMPKKVLAEKTVDVETWAKYAYSMNREFMNSMWAGEFSFCSKEFNEKVDAIARAFNVTAFIDVIDQPYAYIRFGGAFATLFFLDEHKRVYMQYTFQNAVSFDTSAFNKERFKRGDLFLVELEIFKYPEDMINGDWKNKDYISYAFNPDGYLEVTKMYDIHSGNGIEEKYVAESPVNVESNWEPYPTFGEWDSIFRMKRWAEGELPAGFKNPTDYTE